MKTRAVLAALAVVSPATLAEQKPMSAPERFSPTSYGLGFLITGILYVVIGGVIVLVMKNKLAAYNPVPTTTLEEIRKDKQWLKNEI